MVEITQNLQALLHEDQCIFLPTSVIIVTFLFLLHILLALQLFMSFGLLSDLLPFSPTFCLLSPTNFHNFEILPYLIFPLYLRSFVGLNTMLFYFINLLVRWCSSILPRCPDHANFIDHSSLWYFFVFINLSSSSLVLIACTK